MGAQIPSDWSAPAPKIARGKPAEFSAVDGPGDWDNYCFRPKFLSKGNKKYLHHSLPTGAVTVSKDDSNDGMKMEGGWEFFYQGWKSNNSFRDGATKENLFPAERVGCLDIDL